VQHIFEIVRS